MSGRNPKSAGNGIKKSNRILKALIIPALVLGALYGALRIRPPNILEYDIAYWPSKKVKSGEWSWCTTSAGILYNLFIPAAMDNGQAKGDIPLIVVFHGNSGKGTAKDRFGRLFTAAKVQKALDINGAAVLAVQSRVEYFSDPHAYARLIKNIVMEHQCIDKSRIAGYGFSQGAAFVQELAIFDPSLFKAVASGSSYYTAAFPDLFRAARIRFYCATARNDKGIYEQGHLTGIILSLICPASRYVEYENRGHFFIETADKSGRGEESFLDWLTAALSK